MPEPSRPLRVGIVGCGLIGRKRAAALGADVLVACHDVMATASAGLAADFGGRACGTLDEVLETRPDVVIVATVHDQLAGISCRALEAGAHVLVEKPAGIGVAEVERVAATARAAGRLVKVGFNHRFHPGISRAIGEARSGRYGEVLYLRARYGHGGRLGYEREWRADPHRSGGGEIVDQGMHLLDLSYWLLGELPLHSALLRTQFWSAPVDDNAVIVLGGPGGSVTPRRSPSSTSAGPSGRTPSPSRSPATMRSSPSTASCAVTGHRSCGSSGCDRSSGRPRSRPSATGTTTSRGISNGGTSPRRSGPPTDASSSATSPRRATRGPASRPPNAGSRRRAGPPPAHRVFGARAHTVRATGTTASMGTVTDDLAGRRILVTGASKGIGRGVATALAELGASLALVARDAAVLGDLVGGLTGGPHDAIAFDVADERAWLAARPKIAPTGRLDGAVTAAAVIGPIGRVGEWRVDDFRRTLDVNVAGTLLAVTTCLEALRGGGSVVTFSGGGATAPFPRFDSYATSKAAVVRLTENLAVELAPDDIRLNAIAPGFIVTPMHANILAAGPGAVGSQFFERTRAARERGAGGTPPSSSTSSSRTCSPRNPPGSRGGSSARNGTPGKAMRSANACGPSATSRDTAADRRPVLRAGATGTRMTANRAEAGHASTPAAPARKMLSVVIPAYNEEDNVPGIYARLAPTLDGLDCDWEVIFCVDPSTDRTEQVILELREHDPRVRMLRFSRRFGQPTATIAGLEAASGDAVVVIDCDLQDPPELIGELVGKWRDGYDVVYAQRRTRAGETLVKRIVAAAGYRLLRRIANVDIPPNTGDFRLMSRRAVDAVVSLPEQHGFFRGLVGYVGFTQTSVLYDREVRREGRSKYNRFTGSVLIGLNGVIGFSRYPLELISMIGIALASLAFLLGTTYFSCKLAGVHFPVGNPTIVILICFFGGIQLLSLGIIGEYVGRIYDEVRHRPRYFVESRYGWDDADR